MTDLQWMVSTAGVSVVIEVALVLLLSKERKRYFHSVVGGVGGKDGTHLCAVSWALTMGLASAWFRLSIKCPKPWHAQLFFLVQLILTPDLPLPSSISRKSAHFSLNVSLHKSVA